MKVLPLWPIVTGAIGVPSPPSAALRVQVPEITMLGGVVRLAVILTICPKESDQVPNASMYSSAVTLLSSAMVKWRRGTPALFTAWYLPTVPSPTSVSSVLLPASSYLPSACVRVRMASFPRYTPVRFTDSFPNHRDVVVTPNR